MRGQRCSGNAWRYRVVKHWLHRVQKFKSESQTKEQIIAWTEVESWLLSILKNKFLNKNGSIGLPLIWIPEEPFTFSLEK